jgi:hypothetical protein
MTSPRHLGVARALSTLLAIALALSACGGSTTQAPPDESVKTINVVALFDRSESTATTGGNNGSRVGIERAIWPAVFFPNLGRTYTLRVLPVGFASETETWCDWPSADAIETGQTMSQSDKCQTDLKRILPKSITTDALGKDTHFDKALAVAAERLLSNLGTKNVVLLVSDGEFNKGGSNIDCEASPQSEPCQALKDQLDLLNGAGATVCPIFVRTRSSKEQSSSTLKWISSEQKINFSEKANLQPATCPTAEIDLSAQPWALAETIFTWYAEELAGLRKESINVDSSGRTEGRIVVPDGAAQIALVGFKGSESANVKFDAGQCALGPGQEFNSFKYAPVTTDTVAGERCPGAELTGSGLVRNQKLYALFIPGNQELAACTPNSDGGGEFAFVPGFAKLLDFKPRVVWINTKTGMVVDPKLKDDQILEDGKGVAITEDQAIELAALGSDWKVAFDFNGLNKPGTVESYRLLYESVRLRDAGEELFTAREPVSATVEKGKFCAPLFVRHPLQRYLLALVLLGLLATLLIAKRLINGQRIDLAGDLAILDGTGSRSMGSTSISGGSPSWFNVGDRGKVEPGKAEDGKNWRLRWRRGTNVSLEPAEGEAGEWSEGTVKSERGRGFIEFKRVPLLGGSETNTVRYTPEEGTKMGELINKELEDPE